MKRRAFIIRLAGFALCGPSAARAQQAGRLHRIGYLSLGSPAAEATRFDAFRAGLAALGHVEGRNIVIETRWLDGRSYDQLGGLAAELVELKADVIVTYATPGVSAARRVTDTIPIVFATVGDAVAVGLVASLARPGGNVTGTSYFIPELAAKRLELLKEAMPGLERAAVLLNAANRSIEPIVAALRLTARSLTLELEEVRVRDAGDLDGAFATMTTKSVGALVVTEDPMLIYTSRTIATLAQRHRIACAGFSELAHAGGLIAYGIDFPDMWRRAAGFVDKILKGAKPADIPVEQATKFRLEVNLATARALGIAFPLAFLGQADGVIE